MIYIFQIKLPGTMALPEGWLFQQQNSRPFPLAFDTHNVSLHPLLINDLSCGSVFFFHYGDVLYNVQAPILPYQASLTAGVYLSLERCCKKPQKMATTWLLLHGLGASM